MMITSPHIGKRVGKPVSVTRCVTFTRSRDILWAVLYHAVTDNTGSYVHLVNAVTGNADFSASYDAWGRMTTAVNTLPFHRGYGGHEMLTEFGLVNMNGRMYDYNLGRFLSPDNYVQLPHDSQSFNRYSYCLNNPLKYTDPSGELFGIDDLIIGAAAFISSYVSSGISTHNWGWKSVQTGLFSATASLVALHTGGMAGTVWANAGRIAANNAINTFVPSVSIPLSCHTSFSFSPVFGFGTDGFTAGLSLGVNYTDERFSTSFVLGAGKGYAGWFVSAKYGKLGAGVGNTTYGEGNFNNKLLGKQEVGTISLFYKDASLSISNDLFGDGSDRWRTTAVELKIGSYSIGTYVYTNHGGKESGWEEDSWKDTPEKDLYADEMILKITGKMYAWKKGCAYYAPMWLGFTQNGQLFRIGMSGKTIQRLTQNLIHKLIDFPAYNAYSDYISNAYSYYGFHNPVSIW